jgi:hypothetical protein
MGKEKFRTIFYLILVLMAGYQILHTQYLGLKLRFNTFSAPTLTVPDHLSIGLTYQRFMYTVGGVAFDKVALPAETQKVTSLSINYLPNKADGKRLGLTINGKEINTKIYDWQLIPIARFANSSYYSCFTLFGNLTDANKEDEVLNDGGEILNYHPEFTNNLFGFRIAQLDMLILYQDCTDLPTMKGKYILGNGELTPDISSNLTGLNNFLTYANGIQSSLQMKFRSYVICDYGQDIRFDFPKDSLTLTGNPYYYCWRFRNDDPNYSSANITDSIIKDIDQIIQTKKKENPSFNERTWYIDALVEAAKTYKSGYDLYASGTFVDLLKITSTADQKNFLDKYSTSSLWQMLISVKSDMTDYSVVYLKEYSERFSARVDLLQSINPAIWDAAANLMRFGAFFRYCKDNYPDQWKSFLQQTGNINVEPKLNTPTVLYSDGRYINEIKTNNQIESYRLFQNYPNPFNPATSISYQLASTACVELKIFDVLGREIACPVNKIQPAGYYCTNFDTRAISKNLSSGIYFYRLKVRGIDQADPVNYTEIKKMQLLK